MIKAPMTALTAAAFGGLLAVAAPAPAPAHANVIYTFTPDTVTSTRPSSQLRGVGFTLELTDDAVADGSFTLRGSNTISQLPPRYTGDADEFVRFTLDDGLRSPSATPSFLLGALDLSLTFSASGDVTAGRIVGGTLGTDVALDIAGDFVSGYFGSDAPLCPVPTSTRTCFESGSLVRTGGPVSGPSDVPEPASLALLGAGVLGLGAATRRRRRDASAV